MAAKQDVKTSERQSGKILRCGSQQLGSVGAPLSFLISIRSTYSATSLHARTFAKAAWTLRNCGFGGGTSVFAGNSTSAVTFPFANAKVGWTIRTLYLLAKLGYWGKC